MQVVHRSRPAESCENRFGCNVADGVRAGRTVIGALQYLEGGLTVLDTGEGDGSGKHQHMVFHAAGGGLISQGHGLLRIQTDDA